MSLDNSTSKTTLMGNGSNSVPYPFTFVFQDNSHIKVIVTAADGVDTELTSGDFSVTGANDSNGGNVITAAAWDATHKITIYREVPETQETVYTENGDFPAKSHERALDKLTMLVQQLGRKVRAAFRLRESDGDAAEAAKVSNSLFGLSSGGLPVFRNADEVKAWLSLAAPILNFPTKVWADAGERAVAVPDFVGQVGAQTDNGTIWISDGLSAGDWTNPSINLGAGSVTTEMLETAILSADADGLAKIADGFFSADTDGRAKMADGFLTLAKMQPIASGSLIGRASAGTGVPQVITVGDGLTFDGSTLKASGASPAGSVIQTVFATRTSLQSITGSIPFDDTIPTSGEGTQVMTASITPSSTSSKVLVRMTFFGSPSASYPFAVVALRGSTTLRAVAGPENNTYGSLSFEFLDSPASTSSLTYAMNAGISNGTLYVNGTTGGTRVFGGAGMCSITLQEIKG